MNLPTPVRQHVALKGARRRTLLERVALRSPTVIRRLSRAVLSRPPTSRVRRAAVRYLARIIFDAVNRGDHEGALALITSPDFEAITPPDLRGLGFEPVYRGREGRLRFQLQWAAELGDFQQDDIEVRDFGDRLLILVRMKGSGSSSGAGFDTELAYLLTVADGEIIREHSFRSHQQGIDATKLSD
jgi:ketosteroid isomerase-like protein